MPTPLSDRELIARLVGHDTTSERSNRAIADFVSDYLEDFGAVVARVDSADGAKTNVLARIGPEPAGDRRGLILSGHLDVVPADEPEWTSDPFALAERDGTYVGRGACDMKGFVGLAMNVMAATDGAALAAPLMLLLTYDEELGSLGAQRFTATWPPGAPLPRAVLVGEPTSLRVVRMHKGHLKLRIVVRGRAAHTGSPHLGRNAIEPAAAVVTALAGVRAELATRRTPVSAFFPAVPYPVLTVARIRGGAAVNVIPERCTIDVGVRLLPGMSAPALLERLTAEIESAARGATWELETVNDSPPMLIEEDAPVCRAVCAVTGAEETAGVSFASDAGVLRRDLDMECVLYGPGSIEVAHRPDEFVPVVELARAREALVALVARLGGEEGA